MVTGLESIVVLYGGVGSEREVSLLSGQAIADALSKQFTVDLQRIDSVPGEWLEAFIHGRYDEPTEPGIEIKLASES